MRFFGFVALAVFASAQVEIPYEECCPGECLATDGTVIADPDPSTIPIPGNVTVIVSGTLAETVTGGRYSFVARVLGIPVVTESGDICEDFDEVVCPIPAGLIEIKQVTEVPLRPPFGVPIVVHAEAFNEDGKFIICADFSIKV